MVRGLGVMNGCFLDMVSLFKIYGRAEFRHGEGFQGIRDGCGLKDTQMMDGMQSKSFTPSQ